LARAALAFAVDVCRPVSKEQAIAALEQAKEAVASPDGRDGVYEVPAVAWFAE